MSTGVGVGVGIDLGPKIKSGSVVAALLGAGTATGLLLDSLEDEADGMVLDYRFGRELVRDTSTPANERFVTMANGQQVYNDPDPKMVVGPDGLLGYAAHNLFDTPDVPATQGVTVLTGSRLKVVVTGSGSVALSGAGSGTATDGSPVTIAAAASGTLTCTVTGSPDFVQVFRAPAREVAIDGFSVPIEYDPETYDTSSSSNTIGTGEKTWETDLGVTFVEEQAVRASDTNGVDENYMEGIVSSYSGGTLVVDVSYATGSGTISSWHIISPKGGLAWEGEFTELLLYNTQLGNGAWTASQITVDANSAGSPSGLNDADNIVKNATAVGHTLIQNVTSSNTSPFISSAFVKDGGWDWARMSLDFGAGGFRRFWADTAGSIGTDDGIATLVNGPFISAYKNDWHRIAISGSGASGTTRALFLVPQSADNQTALTGDGSKGVYGWMLSLGLGSFPSSPIESFGSTVTRAADDLSLATSTFNWSDTAGSVIVNARTALGGGTQVLWCGHDGTSDETITVFRDASDEIHAEWTDGGVVQADLNLGAVADDTEFKVAIAWSAGSFSGQITGGTRQTDASGTLPIVDTIQFGADESLVNHWNGGKAWWKHLPTELSEAEMASEVAV